MELQCPYMMLKQAFIDFRAGAAPGCNDADRQTAWDRGRARLNEARKALAQEDTTEGRFARYCMDVMDNVLKSGNRQEIYDFADAMHNMPEAGLPAANGGRRIASFRPEVDFLRKRYGEAWFADFFPISQPAENSLQKLGSFSGRSPLLLLAATVAGSMAALMILGVVHGIETILMPIPAGWSERLMQMPVTMAVWVWALFLLVNLTGVIVGAVKRRERGAVRCMVLSALGLAINLLLIAGMLYAGATF